ncbi:MAG TPA: 5-(carboxyamino)imidazole ribonucleotide synthase [Streptosporangiaceae bacterium]|nr:5-(carboxyamino)imidazole ribonucleotide synthase [Streptosporangiaceae bacterium]
MNTNEPHAPPGERGQAGSVREAARAAPAPADARVPVVGMVGAGQLARMTSPAATGLGIRFRVLAAAADESAAQVTAETVVGDYGDRAELLAFAAGCDVVTFDHEHVPGQLIEAMEAAGFAVRPGSAALRYTQDKRAMRERVAALGYRCPRFVPVAGLGEVTAFAEQVGWPVVLKAVTGGYDGRGVWVCAGPQDAGEVLAHGLDLIAEEHVAFDRELAILVARSPAGQGAAYPVVQTVQQDGICREVLAPAPGLSLAVAAQAQELGLALARDLGVTGLLAVELFETADGLLVNELAMRPHNSGHWTIEGAVTSQFEQHLRAVLNLPLGAPSLASRWSVMVNVLGGDDPDLQGRLTHVMAADPGVKIHLYGKPVRPGRKVGHVTALGRDLERVRDRARRAASYLAWGTEDAGDFR